MSLGLLGNTIYNTFCAVTFKNSYIYVKINYALPQAIRTVRMRKKERERQRERKTREEKSYLVEFLRFNEIL